MIVTLLGQQYNVGEKPTAILHTCINRHAGTPDKKQKQNRNNVVQHPPVFSRQSFSSDSMGSDSGITSREGWCTTDAGNRKEMSVL